MGYQRVRHYGGGLVGWQEAGGVLESGVPRRSGAAVTPSRGTTERGSRTLGGWSDRLVDLAGNASFAALLGTWVGMVLVFGVAYWVLGAAGAIALREDGNPVVADLHGFWTSIYFSFVTATSIGFGDVTPLGAARVLALVEASAELLLFGAVVSKLVSRRQEQLIEEIHRIAFEDRLGRVRTNLHLVLSDLQSVGSECDRAGLAEGRMLQRVESAAMVFTGELRAIHDLLYRPQQDPEEEVLESILAGVAAGLAEFQGMLARCPDAPSRSPMLRTTFGAMRRLAGEICGECVPRSYAAHLKTWMDRIQEMSRGLGAVAAERL